MLNKRQKRNINIFYLWGAREYEFDLFYCSFNARGCNDCVSLFDIQKSKY